MMETDNKQICVLGMGYVGITLSVVLAEVGYQVDGIDIDKEVVTTLNKGNPHIYEKNLAIRLRQQVKNNRAQFFTEAPDIYYDSIIVSVGTPLKEGTKEPNLSYLRQVIKDVARLIRKGTLVCMRSTIPVGCIRADILPVLESESGLRVGTDFYLASTPERTIEGKALQELRENSQIVGGITELCAEKAANLFLKITSTVVTVSSVEVAEFSKIIDNTFRDFKFSFANEMALISEKIGIDIHEVINAANLHYPRNVIPVPSPGVGGACLSKDPHILIDVAKRYNHHSRLISEARNINESYPGLIAKRIQKEFTHLGGKLDQATVMVVGFAFKGNPETADLRNSTTITLVEELRSLSKCSIKGFDPIVKKGDIQLIEGVQAVELEDGFDKIDILILANNHETYRDWDISMILSKMNRPAIIYDGWRMLDKNIVEEYENVVYMSPGL